MSGAWGLIYGFRIGAPQPAVAQAGRFFPYGFPYGGTGGVVPPTPETGGGKEWIVQGKLKRVRRRRSEHEKLSQLIEVMLGGEVVRAVETEPPPYIHVAYSVPEKLKRDAQRAEALKTQIEKLKVGISLAASRLEEDDENDIEILLLFGSH
jgi:hypothetical protein